MPWKNENMEIADFDQCCFCIMTYTSTQVFSLSFFFSRVSCFRGSAVYVHNFFLLLSLSLFDNQRPFLVTPQLARGLQVDYSTLEACAYCREAKGMYGSIG